MLNFLTLPHIVFRTKHETAACVSFVTQSDYEVQHVNVQYEIDLKMFQQTMNPAHVISFHNGTNSYPSKPVTIPTIQTRRN